MKEKYIYQMFNYGIRLSSENEEYTEILDMEGIIVERIPTIEAKELKKRSDKMLNFIIDLNEKLGDNEGFSEFFYEFKDNCEE